MHKCLILWLLPLETLGLAPKQLGGWGSCEHDDFFLALFFDKEFN